MRTQSLGGSWGGSWHTARRLAVTGAALLALATMMPPAAATDARAATAVRVLLDRPIDAMAAPLLVTSRKTAAAENLSVTVIPGNSAGNGGAALAGDIFSRLAAGDGDMALADINALIRYRDRSDAAALKAVYMLTNTAAYAIVARRSRGIRTLADLAGKTVGFVDDEMAIALWPVLARLNGLADDKVKLQRIGAAVREPMLSAGQLDAVTGLSYLSPINLRDRGIPGNDLAVFRYADHGIAAYGLAVVVNPAFLAAQPEAVHGFVRALNVALHMTVKAPAAAIEEVLAQMSNGIQAIELERLQDIIRNDIVTAETRRDGLGGIDPERFATAVEQLAEGAKLRVKPAPGDIFDETFLPARDSRTLD